MDVSDAETSDRYGRALEGDRTSLPRQVVLTPLKDTQEGAAGSKLTHGPGTLETMAVTLPVPTVSAALHQESAGCAAQME